MVVAPRREEQRAWIVLDSDVKAKRFTKEVGSDGWQPVVQSPQRRRFAWRWARTLLVWSNDLFYETEDFLDRVVTQGRRE